MHELYIPIKHSSLVFFIYRILKRHSFSCMLIFSPHNLNLCLESQETRFLWNIFEAVQNTRSTCFIGFKNTRLRLVFLNPIKHCCSCFKQYISIYNLVCTSQACRQPCILWMICTYHMDDIHVPHVWNLWGTCMDLTWWHACTQYMRPMDTNVAPKLLYPTHFI